MTRCQAITVLQTITADYMTAYYLLLDNLYTNKSRLKDVKNIHAINGIIYYDVHIPNMELCNC